MAVSQLAFIFLFVAVTTTYVHATPTLGDIEALRLLVLDGVSSLASTAVNGFGNTENFRSGNYGVYNGNVYSRGYKSNCGAGVRGKLCGPA